MKKTFKSVLSLSVLAATLGASAPGQASEPFIGQIQYFGFNFAPRNWAFCDGRLLPIAQYNALFSLLGTFYGGDGKTTFALPDARGRVLIGQGQGPGLPSFPIGSKGGSTSNTLTVANLPSHTHTATLNANSAAATVADPATNTVLAGGGRNNLYSTSAPDVGMTAAVTVNNTGGSQPVNNMQPYLTVNCSIALEGLYPSRS